ncbi:IS110 family transposase [Streptomyces zaomyceticus]|uniref:IS110 family transposase n=1 Tax=Streptomyces zaomyceticus TaxID=68286 RepID=UPI002E10547F|nr:IS110 family transposase [Streptomyces zaomyceticus]WSQ19612.1 IS110 family transposase [Streptomyces zaomyceticus]WSQ21760.1 IS110 family transposase [Streptomyces zaomyceticus]
MGTQHQRIWVGIDVGKGHHWAVAVDAEGETVFSTKVINDESQVLQLIATARERADEVRWAVDISSRPAALLLALLLADGQPVVYIPGKTVNRMTGAYRGEGKTDAKDARIIADLARMRRDFKPVQPSVELTSGLQLLVGYRADQIAERVRLINRLREVLVGVSPALERAFDYRKRPGLILLTGYQTPAGIRRIGVKRLTAWLARRAVRNAQSFAECAVEAAAAQSSVLPGEELAARLVRDLAHRILELDERIKANDKEIAALFRTDERAAIIESMPGMGPILGAELLAIVGDLSAHKDAGHLAAHAGLAPVPRDSGRKTGNLHRPKHYSRRLRYVFYMSSLVAMRMPGASQDYYGKKRSEGLLHTQAILSLARRRVDVLWAMLRDKRTFTPTSPSPQAA